LAGINVKNLPSAEAYRGSPKTENLKKKNRGDLGYLEILKTVRIWEKEKHLDRRRAESSKGRGTVGQMVFHFDLKRP